MLFYLYSASSLTQQSTGRRVPPLTHYPDSKPTILCSYSLKLGAGSVGMGTKYRYMIELYELQGPLGQH